MYDIFYVPVDGNFKFFENLKLRYPRAQIVNDLESFDDLKKLAFTKMFWVIWDTAILRNDFDLDSYSADQWDDMYVHIFKNDNDTDGICLFPKRVDVSSKEWSDRYFLRRKETGIITSNMPVYNRYVIETYDQYLEILETSDTELFWSIWPDLTITDESIFNLYFDAHNTYDKSENHIYKNSCNGVVSYVGGVVLFSKVKPISKREFESRYLVDKKEHNVLISKSRYPRYNIDTYDQYLDIIEKETSPLFWCVWNNVEIIDESIFDLYFDSNDGRYDFDRSINHVFKNGCGDIETYLNGVVLFSKDKPVSQIEFKRKFLIDKKEHELLVSRFRYPRYNIDTYDQYLGIIETETSPLFWCVWNNVEIIDESIFDLYFDPNNGVYDFDRSINHVFKNGCGNKETYLNGLILCSKDSRISQTEFKRKFLIDKKEHNDLVSRFRYPRYNIDTYDQYLEIIETETSPLFWCIWPEIDVVDNTVFDLYFDPNDGVYDFDRSINHSFLHQFKSDSLTNNGLMLLSTASTLSKREIEYRNILNVKEHSSVASVHKKYDIVFISYNELNADNNYNKLIERFPNAKRVSGITGIHNAHIAAAKMATTDMFWAVDGDAEIVESFDFDHPVSRYDRDIVYVWQSCNPINDLVYGYGGVKLLPTTMTMEMDSGSIDMTTSISKRFKAVDKISNITAFNTDAFSTWRSAFRECVKLSSRTIDRQNVDETAERLTRWTTLFEDKPFAQEAVAGAIAGRKFGQENAANPAALKLINDFNWLKQEFESRNN